MSASYHRFLRGFLRGSLLGCSLVALGLLGWFIATLIGAEKDASLTGFSLTALYVLSFGLGGGVFGLLRRTPSRFHESALAWAGALAVVLLGCGVVAGLSQSAATIEWYWGVGGGGTALLLLLGASIHGLRRSAEPGAPPNGGLVASAGDSAATGGPPSVS